MITITANTPVTRPNLRASSFAFKGFQFDLGRSLNMYQSKETGICFNTPNFLRQNYYTDFTGLNTRLTLSDFGISSGWQETFINDPGNIFLEKKSTASSQVLTYSTDITSETGFVITYHNYTSESEIEDAIKFDFWDDAEAINKIRCELLTDGNLTLIVNDDVVLEDSIGNTKANTFAVTGGKFISVGIIPFFAGRGILLIFSTGKEVFYYDESFEDFTDPLWMNTQFRIHVPVRASISVSKMGFVPVGTLYSEEFWFNEKPDLSFQSVDSYVSKVYGGITSKSLVNNNLVAYTNEDTCRLKVVTELVSSIPPFISSAFVDILGTTSDSPANNTNITTLTREVSFTFPEDNTQSSSDITVKGIETLQNNYMYLSTPMTVKYNGCTFIRGIVSDIEYMYNVQYDLNTTPIRMTLPNFWYALEQYTFKDALVLDGYNFVDAVKRILNEVGFPNSLTYIQSTTFDIPIDKFSIDEYQFKIDIGTTAKDALIELFDTYAGNYIYQFRPIGGNTWFIAGDTDFVSANTIKYQFYTKLEDAKLDANYNSAHPGRLLARNVKLTPMALEANAIYVNGQDPVTKNNIQVYKKDYNSINHTIAIASRPKNWCGFEKPYGYQNKSITSSFLAERVVNQLYDKLTKLTRLVEFECYLGYYEESSLAYIMYPWDRINLDPVGDMTIISISGNVRMHEQSESDTAKNGIKVNVVAKQQWDEENEIWTYLNFN